MNININNRLVLIVGPSTTGKTTLSKKIEKESQMKSVIISHDEVLEKIDKNQSQKQIDEKFHLEFIHQICDAIDEQSNELIILDTLNFDSKALFSVLFILRMFINYADGITLIKMNPPLELHKKYVQERSKVNELVNLSAILSQRMHYISNQGSLFRTYDLANEEIIISNPENVTLNFGIRDSSKVNVNK